VIGWDDDGSRRPSFVKSEVDAHATYAGSTVVDEVNLVPLEVSITGAAVSKEFSESKCSTPGKACGCPCCCSADVACVVCEHASHCVERDTDPVERGRRGLGLVVEGEDPVESLTSLMVWGTGRHDVEVEHGTHV